MAVIEICDVCKKRLSECNGIELTASDMNGLDFVGIEQVRCRRKYKIRICDKCIENIKKYCKENI